MSVRVRQVLVGIGGTVIVVVLLVLGLWQMRVFEDREAYSAEVRASQPAVALLDFVAADGTIGDVYGRQVSVTGRYLDEQVLVTSADGAPRLLTAFQLADQRVVAIVRGTSTSTPAPPSGTITQTGVLLPTETRSDGATTGEALGSVRLPELAQRWPQQLLAGFITLGAPESTAQGLTPATAVLPSGEGSLQNLGYAMQWWVFAAFAALMTWRFVAVLGRRGGLGTLAGQEDE